MKKNPGRGRSASQKYIRITRRGEKRMSAAKRRKLNSEDTKSVQQQSADMYPVLPDELCEDTPLEEVYIDEIVNMKDTSKVIVELNAILPINELAHLKRIKNPAILLFPTAVCAKEEVHQYLENKKFNTAYLKNNVTTIKVARIPPKTRRQYDAVQKLWPCNFHSNKYLEKLVTNTLFTKKEIDDHKLFMEMAVDVAKYSKEKHQLDTVGVVVVDPKIESVAAVGYDSKATSPVGHAIMRAIDNVAKSQNGGAWGRDELVRYRNEFSKFQKGIPLDYLLYLQEKYTDVSFGAVMYRGKHDLDEPKDGPYLCTGYYIYVTHEPCIMCSMALVHSRVKRVFFGAKSKNGGVSTLCKIHTVKDLNHHYEVFGGLLESECLKL